MATKLFFNATIYTVNATFDQANALLIKDDKILFVGDILALPNVEIQERIDCHGAFIYPGFIDPHGHFIDLGKSYFTANLYASYSFDEVIQICQDFKTANPENWILGRGWNQNNWDDKSLPNKKLLDELFPDTPVLLIRVDSHVGLINQKAIDLTNVIQQKYIDGNEIEFKNDEVTGIVYDKALYHVLEYVKPDEATKIKYIQKATDICFSLGLTSIGDAFMTYEDFQVYKELNENQELRMQVFGMMIPSDENKSYLKSFGAYQKNNLFINSTKHFADGALGSRGAALLAPYDDAQDKMGMLLESDAYWDAEAKFCIENNLQMITHAIGDAANKRIFQLYKKYLQPNNQLRWRIEHLQMIDEEDLADLKTYAIVPSIQSTHGTSDYSWAISRIGEERMKKSYRVKDILDTCSMFANGSDFPIEKPNPLRGFYASITRKDDQQQPENGFAPEQKIDRISALKSMTIWAAYAQFEEQQKGSLEVGKNADFVMLEKDIMNCDEAEILDVKVIQTFVKGQSVYRIDDAY